MSAFLRRRSPWQKFSLILLAFLLVVIVSLGIYRVGSGRSLGIRSLASGAVSFVKGLANSDLITQTTKGEYTNVIFLHHSVGQNLIAEGHVRELFNEAGISFWDHDYNGIGLRDPAGNYLDFSYNIPGDNTDIIGLVTLFGQPTYQQPVNALSSLLQHEVIILKSCFPNSAISSDEQLQLNKDQYIFIRSVMDRYPEKLFVIVTQPPLTPAETVSADANRARELASWLKSDEFLADRANIRTYDFFDQLASNNEASPERNMLRGEYRNGIDSHPNRAANESIAPVFVDFVLAEINAFRAE